MIHANTKRNKNRAERHFLSRCLSQSHYKLSFTMTAFVDSPTNSLNTLNGISYNFLDNVPSLSAFVGELSSPLQAVSVSKDVTAAKKAPSKTSKQKKTLPVSRKTQAKSKRSRRFIPENKDYIEGGPTDVDVTGGRGGKSNHHPGNKPYWDLILTHRSTYRGLQSDFDKKNLARLVANKIIEESGGRFLLKEKSTGLWFQMPEQAYLDKIQQAFRDKYIVEWAQDWAKEDFPEEYALFLQKDKKKTKKTKTEMKGRVRITPKEAVPSSTTTTTTASKHDTTPSKVSTVVPGKLTSKLDMNPSQIMASLQNSADDALNVSLCYSDGGLSFGSMSSLSRDPLVAAALCASRVPSLDLNKKERSKVKEHYRTPSHEELKNDRRRPRENNRRDDWVMKEYYCSNTIEAV